MRFPLIQDSSPVERAGVSLQRNPPGAPPVQTHATLIGGAVG